ncbi:MAG TPA: hypothetical protein VK524_03030, partial [Polyangiaceae bacterium]|nr:hypothetical protein [Polyangiaceae bacterium]
MHTPARLKDRFLVINAPRLSELFSPVQTPGHSPVSFCYLSPVMREDDPVSWSAVEAAAKTHFGVVQFRPGQRELL